MQILNAQLPAVNDSEPPIWGETTANIGCGRNLGWWNGAEIWGEPFDPRDPRLRIEVTITAANSKKSKRWTAYGIRLGVLMQALICHRKRRQKDGPALVLGEIAPDQEHEDDAGRRLNKHVRVLYGCALDLDDDVFGDELRDLIAASGLLAVAYSTHSHLQPGKGERWRLVVFFLVPFDIETEGGLWLARLKWRSICDGLAAKLGVTLDPSRRDLAGAFYFPAYAPGAPHKSYVFGGDLWDWRKALEAFEDPRASRTTREPRDGAQWAPDGSYGGGGSRSLTEVGRALGRWSRDYATGFQVADAICDYARERVRSEDGPKIEIECPFDDGHSNPGDPTDRGCAAWNSGDADAPIFIVSCRHAHCQGKTPQDFLGRMLELQWLPASVLTDPAYNPETH